MNIPDQLTAGDSWEWLESPIARQAGAYRSDTYALTYYLRGPAGAIDITSTPQPGGGWLCQATATATADLPSGRYNWSAKLTYNNVVITPSYGSVEILPNFATLDTLETRTPAEICLASAESALQGWQESGGAIKRYRIAGTQGYREQEFQTVEDLQNLVAYWRGVVSRERRDRAIAEGRPDPTQRLARFNRV